MDDELFWRAAGAMAVVLLLGAGTLCLVLMLLDAVLGM